ncbi:uncharacterized protein [Diadema antillarum]|uniref:uncharacterized protein n=1 Tax=Diadema antillarum TaxID=105358 RepID=UPI003A88D75A
MSRFSSPAVLVLFLGLAAVACARIDVGKALGRVRLATSYRGILPHERSRPVPVEISSGLFPKEPAVRGNGVEDQVGAGGVEAASTTTASGPTAQCQTVAQWEGRASEWDHLQGNNDRFNISFDGINRRKHIREDKRAQLPGKRIYEYIQLFDDGIQYVINRNYNTCHVEPLGTWRNHTIPPNATLEDRYEVGAPGSGFMVQEWSDRIPGRRKETWIGTFTDVGCWPVTETFMERDDQTLEMVQSVSTRFFDLSQGIKDMSIFTPPKFCNKSASSSATTAEPSTASSRRVPVRQSTQWRRVDVPLVAPQRSAGPLYDVLSNPSRERGPIDQDHGSFFNMLRVTCERILGRPIHVRRVHPYLISLMSQQRFFSMSPDQKFNFCSGKFLRM